MRKQDSITNKLFEAINCYNVGDIFTVSQVYDYTMACNSMYGSRQRVYDLLCFLNKTGLITRVKRGTYKVMFPIPAELTFTDLEVYNGYTTRGTFTDEGYKSVPRKQNPFDIDAYKASFTTPHSCGNVVEVEQPTTMMNVYEVNMKTGQVTPKPVPVYDNSHLSQFNVFADEDSALAFAEGIVPERDESDDDLDNALEEIENDIVSTLHAESDPASDPEYTPLDITEEEFNEAKSKMLTLELEQSDCEPESPGTGAEFVKLLIKPGTEVFIIEEEEGTCARLIKDVIDDCQINVDRSAEVNYTFSTSERYKFGKKDLGVTVFTTKEDAAATLIELF